MLTCDKLGTPATAISSTFARNYTKLLNSTHSISSTLARSLHPLHNFKKITKTKKTKTKTTKKKNMSERMRNMQKTPRGIVCKVVERPAAEKPSSLEGQLLKSGPAFPEDWLKSHPTFLEDWRLP